MQRYFVKGIKNNVFLFESSDIHHIKNVMRMHVSDVIECVFENELYRGEITSLDPLNVVVLKKLDSVKFNKPYVVMVIPLLNEVKMDYIFQKCTELGVDEFCIYDAVRSKVKLNSEKFSKKVVRWLKICKEASEQSHRVCIPVISGLYKVNDLKELSGLNLVCSTNVAKSFKNALKKDGNYDRINIVVGPEGGIDPKEEDLLVSFGYLRTSLGPTVLRCETAPICAISYINYEFMEL